MIMLREAVTAIRTLTIIPVPGKECEVYSNSLHFFPFIGFIISCILFGLATALNTVSFDYPLIEGFILTIFITLITGALHLDGLADTADGLIGGTTREKSLEIMKDPRHGTFGVTAITFLIIGKIGAYSVLVAEWYPWYFWCGPILSRTIMAFICSAFPYARINGKAQNYFRKDRAVMISMLVIMVLGMCLSIIFALKSFLIVFVLTLGSSFFVTGYCLSRLGGITGDCLGAINEITEILFLYSSIGVEHFFR